MAEEEEGGGGVGDCESDILGDRCDVMLKKMVLEDGEGYRPGGRLWNDVWDESKGMEWNGDWVRGFGASYAHWRTRNVWME